MFLSYISHQLKFFYVQKLYLRHIHTCLSNFYVCVSKFVSVTYSSSMFFSWFSDQRSNFFKKNIFYYYFIALIYRIVDLNPVCLTFSLSWALDR